MLDWQPKAPYTAEQLLEILRILRDPENGCPWDKVQTHASIRKNFLEETCEALEAQKTALRSAEKFIFMEYHAIEDASAWQELEDILAERAAHGVEVRVFYDDVGSIGFINSKFVKKLAGRGIQCRRFNPGAESTQVELHAQGVAKGRRAAEREAHGVARRAGRLGLDGDTAAALVKAQRLGGGELALALQVVVPLEAFGHGAVPVGEGAKGPGQHLGHLGVHGGHLRGAHRGQGFEGADALGVFAVVKLQVVQRHARRAYAEFACAA